MVGVVAGSGLGLFNTATANQGDHGTAVRGVHVNTASGNLVVQAQDRLLAASGTDIIAQRTYNLFGNSSAGGWSGDDARRVVLAGTRNVTGSVVLRTAADGNESRFAWNGTRYVCRDGDGAHDLIDWDAASASWVYTEGTSRLQERYDGSTGLLASLRDPSGNEVTLARDEIGRLLSQRDAASGQEILYVYGDNGKLIRLDTRSTAGGALTRQVYFSYDTFGRLTQVATDLSPGDNRITDGLVALTEYTWDGDSQRLSGIGVNNAWTRIEYIEANGQHRVRRVTDSAGSTHFAYDDAQRTTTLTSHAGAQWVYVHDAGGRLVELQAPPADGIARVWRYSYDGAGNLAGLTDATGRSRQWRYDGAGNLLREWDDAGQLVERSWLASNRLLTETRYANAATLAGGDAVAPADGAVLVTRHVHDASLRLRFVISEEGAVTEHRYDARGLLVQTSRYTQARYNVSALAATAVPSEAAMASWAAQAGVRAQQLQTRYQYDVRGNLAAIDEYARVDAAGAGIEDAAMRRTEYVHAEDGRLLQTYRVSGSERQTRGLVTAYGYDNAGRLVSETDAQGTRTHAHDGANRRLIVSHSAGLVVVTATDAEGRLLSRTESVSGEGSRETRYVHEGGRLRMIQTPDGARSYSFYDAGGRQVAQVNALGEVIEFVFDAAGRQTAEIRYATRVDTAGWFDGTRVLPADVSGVRPPASDRDRAVRFSYDATGRRVQVTDAAGTATTSEFDAAGRIVAQRSGDRLLRWFYSDEGLLLAQLDAEGGLVRHEYDAAGQRKRSIRHVDFVAGELREGSTLAQLMGSAGNNVRNTWFLYDAAGRQTAEIDEQQFVSVWHHDDAGRTRRHVRYLAPYTLANAGALTLDTLLASSILQGSEALVSSETFNAFGQVASRTDFSGVLTTFIYDAHGRLVREIAADGTAESRETRYLHDARSRVVGRVRGEVIPRIAGSSTPLTFSYCATYGEAYTYDLAGNRAQVTARGGAVTTWYYDPAGRITHVIDAGGAVREYSLNAFGEAESTRDLAIALTAAQRGPLTGGRLAPEHAALLASLRDEVRDSLVRATYTARGQLDTRIDAEGHRTRYTWTAHGEAATVERERHDGQWLVDRYTWNRRGEQLAQVQDADGLAVRTSQRYNALGEVFQRTDARGRNSSAAWSASGRTVTRTDVIGRATTQQFDALGRLLVEIDVLGNVTTHRWDDAARTHTITTPEGLVTVSARNAHGQEIAVTDAQGVGTRYSYNRDGALLTVTDAEGVVTSCNTYDNQGRLAVREQAGRGSVEYTWDAAGRELTRRELATGLLTSTVWDAAGRQVSVTETAGTVSQVTTFVHDRNGLLLTRTRDAGGLALRTDWTWDALGRQLTVTEGSAAEPVASLTRYAYDALGRITQEVRDPQGLALTTQNRYDASGRLTRVVHADGSSRWHVYDDAGQLRYTVNALGEVTGHEYDGNGRLVSTVRYASRVDTSGLADVVTSLPVTADAARDARTWTVRDRDGREKYLVDAMGRVTELVYDAQGNVSSRIHSGRELPARLLAWQAEFSNAAQAFANPALIATQPDIYALDTLQRELVITHAAGNSGASFLYAREQSYRSGIGFGVTLATGSSLPAKALFGMANRLPAAGGTARRLALGITDGYFTADIVVGTAWRAVRLGAVQANAVYQVEFETRAASVCMWVYRQGQAREEGYFHEVQGAGWNSVAFCAWGFRAPTADGSRIRLGELREFTRAADPQSVTMHQRHDALGRVRFHVDARGAVTEEVYNANGQRVETRRYAQLLSAPVPADAAGLQALLDGQSYRATRYFHDAAGRLAWQVAMTSPLASGEVQGWLYDARGRVIAERAFAVADANFLTPSPSSLSASSLLARWNATAATQRRETRHVYDKTDRRRVSIDAGGGATAFDYDALGRMTRSTRFLNGYSGTLNAGSDGAVVAAQLAAANTAPAMQRVTRFVHDAAGRLRYEIDAMGGIREFSRDALGNVWQERTWLTDQRTAIGDGSEATIAAALAGVAYRRTLYVHDLAGRLRYTLDAANFLGEIRYDTLGRIVARTRYAEAVTDSALTAAGAPLGANAFDGIATAQTAAQAMRRTRYAYDADGQLRFSVDAAGFITEQVRDAFGRVIRETSHGLATAVATEASTDALAAEVVRLSSRAGYTQRNTWIRHDAAGNAVLSVDALGFVTRREFDAFGAVIAESRHAEPLSAPLADTQSLADVRQRTDFRASEGSAARSTRFLRDSLGRITEQRDAEALHAVDGVEVAGQRITRFLFDGFGQLKELREGEVLTASGAITTGVRSTLYEYDALGRQVRTVLPGWHDATDGRVHAERGSTVPARRQLQVTVQYDAFGDKVFESRALNPVTDATRDVAATRRVFDALGRLRFEVDALGGVTETRHDALANTQTVIRYAQVVAVASLPARMTEASLLPGGSLKLVANAQLDRQITTRFDALGQKVSVQQGSVEVWQYGGDGANPASGVAVVSGRGADAVTGYALVDGVNAQATPEVRYEYNAWGELVRERVTGGGDTWHYRDALGRVVSSVDAGGYLTLREYHADSTRVARETQFTQAIDTRSLTVDLPPVLPAGLQEKDRVTVYEHDALLRVSSIRLENVGRRYQTLDDAGLATGTVIEAGRVLPVEARSYNAWGESVSVTDAAGNVTRNEYDAAGRLVKVVEPPRAASRLNAALGSVIVAAPTVSFTYNVFGDIVTQTRRAGAGQLGLEQTTRNHYDHAGNVIAQDDALGNRREFHVDGFGRTVREQQSVTLDWQGIGDWENVSQLIRRDYAWDSLGRQLATIDHYTDADGIARTTTQSVQYNVFGEVARRLLNGNSLESHEYDRAGRHVRTLGASGDIRLDYDVAGRLTRKRQQDPEARLAARVTVYRHDALGRVTEERLPAARSHTGAEATADADWLETSVSYGGTRVIPLVTLQYDRWGNVTQRTDALGAVTRQAWDHLGRLVEETLPQTDATREDGTRVEGSLVRQYVYADDGNLTLRVEFFREADGRIGKGRVRRMEYNAAGQLTAETDATGNRREYRVDAHGNRHLTRDGEGQWSYDIHDALNRVVTHGNIIWNNWVAARRNVYDAAGRVYMEVFGVTASDETRALLADASADFGGIRVTGDVGNTRLSHYDERGNVTATRNESGVVERHVFDTDNRKSETLDAIGGRRLWTYSNAAFGRLASYTDLAGSRFEYAYNGFGERVSETLRARAAANSAVIGNVEGSQVTYHYDTAGRLWKTSQRETRGSNARTVESATLRGYDAAGNLLAEHTRQTLIDVAVNITSQRVFYQLDVLGRIIGSHSPDATGAHHDALTRAYTTTALTFLTIAYDEFGNRRNVVLGEDAGTDIDNWYTYDAENRVLVSEGLRNASGTITLGEVSGKAKGTRVSYDRSGRRASEERWARNASVRALDGVALSTVMDQYKLATFAYTFDDHVASVIERNVFRSNGTDGTSVPVAYTKIRYVTESGSLLTEDAGKTYVRELNTYDGRGNRLTQRRYGPYQGLASHHNYFYRGDGQLLLQQDFLDWMVLHGQTVMGESDADAPMRDAAGNQQHYRHESYLPDGVTREATQQYTLAYVAFDTYRQSRVTARQDGLRDGVTEFTYTVRGDLLRTRVGSLERNFINNADGRLTARHEGSKSQRYIHRDGAALVEYGTAGATALAAAFVSASEGEARGGVSRYTVAGDNETAESIALGVYGDTRYWYIVADANGLASGTQAVEAGTTLSLPNVLANNFNSAATVASYRQEDVVGNTTPVPQPPPPPKPKSAALKQVVMIVVAVVVTFATAGAAAPGVGASFSAGTSLLSSMAGQSLLSAAFWQSAGALALGAMAGSAASQLVGRGLGVVDEFSWREVGKAGVTGLLTSVGIGALGHLPGVRALGQKYDWVQSARGAAAGYAGNHAGSRLFGENPSFNWQALAGSTLVAGGLEFAFENWGGSLKPDGDGHARQLARSGLKAGAAAHLEDKWFGGARPSYGAVANGVVAQFLAEKAGAAWDGRASTNGGAAVPGGAGTEAALDARVVLTNAEPEVMPEILRGPRNLWRDPGASWSGLVIGTDAGNEGGWEGARPFDGVLTGDIDLDAQSLRLPASGRASVARGEGLEAFARRQGGADWRAVYTSLMEMNTFQFDANGNPLLREGQDLRFRFASAMSAAERESANRIGGSMVGGIARQASANEARASALLAARADVSGADVPAVAGGDDELFIDALLNGPDSVLVQAARLPANPSAMAMTAGTRSGGSLRKLGAMVAQGAAAIEVPALVTARDSLLAHLQAFGNEQAAQGNTFLMHLGGVAYATTTAFFPTSAIDVIPLGRGISALGKVARMVDEVPGPRALADSAVKSSAQSSAARRAILSQKYGRTGDIDADINIKGRQAAARSFYEDAGFSGRRLESHLKGIDYTQDVDVFTIPAGRQVAQWQPPGTTTGNYFSRVGGDPNRMGIDPEGRELLIYAPKQRTVVLRSTAADIPSWKEEGRTYYGGEIQYFAKEPSVFVLLGWGK